ncbi:hypothetical protein SBDP1_700029 [Syntrophobacter sp. SbD1]|nr:hypothetical protein SBDP1_700029 [Syntrophobacter sp. SbD1]
MCSRLAESGVNPIKLNREGNHHEYYITAHYGICCWSWCRGIGILSVQKKSTHGR